MSRRVVLGLLPLGVFAAAAVWSWIRPVCLLPPPLATPEPVVEWVYDAPDPGGFLATPAVADGVAVVSAVLTRGLTQRGGVYAVDASTGKQLWAQSGDGTMRPSASGPAVDGGRVFVGEGMHADFSCRLRALDLKTGAVVWGVPARDHLEAGPTVSGGVVYASAGNDGVLALDARTGDKRWQFTADLHVDTRPAVTDALVIVGSGPSRRFRSLAVVALDRGTGQVVWRTPVDLPAWGSPAVAGGRVYVGLGNGRMTEPARPPDTPAGALLCLDLASGKELWRVRAADAVFQRPTVDTGRVFFGSRDASVVCADAVTGGVVWRTDRPGPVIAPVALTAHDVVAVTQSGLLAGLDRLTGRERWRFDLAAHTKAVPLCVAAPVVSGNKLYFAAELDTPAGRVASLYRFAVPPSEGSP